MEKIGNRSLIKVCTALHQRQVETHQQLIKVYGRTLLIQKVMHKGGPLFLEPAEIM